MLVLSHKDYAEPSPEKDYDLGIPAAYSLIVSLCEGWWFSSDASGWEEALIFESGDTLRTVKAESYFI